MFTAVMFLANAFAVSAWSQPCLDMNGSSFTLEMVDKNDEPCHEQSSDNEPCCEGLCVHCHVNPAPHTYNSEVLIFNVIGKDNLFSYEDRLSSVDLLPPRRPPKLSS